MTITTLSSREFNQDTSRAKKAADKGPVFITDRGRPAHVLLRIEEYQRLVGGHRKIADALAMQGVEDIAFDPPKVIVDSRQADFLLMFVLDTNVVSELRKVRSGKADVNVAEWADSVDAINLYVSAITILELETGVLRMEQRDRTQGAILRAWMDNHVLPEFSERVLPVDTAVARRCAGLHVPDPRSERDALIAATALVHGMAVVTRNLADFEPTGVKLFNPWNDLR